MLEVIAALVALDCQLFISNEQCIKDQATCIEKIMTEKRDSDFTVLEYPMKLAVAYKYCKENSYRVNNGNASYDIDNVNIYENFDNLKI